MKYINFADPPSKQAADINDNFSEIGTGGGGEATVSSADIVDATTVGRSVLTAVSMEEARTAIGAGTSNLTLGTTASTALAGNTPLLAIGTTATTAKAGNYQPTAANISDSTAIGRSVLTAVDAAAARTAIGAGTSSLAIGTTGTTAAAGNHGHSVATTTTAGFMSATDKAKLESVPTSGVMVRATAQPETPTSPGEVGQWWASEDEFFICVAPDTWRVVALSTWTP